MKGDQNSHDPAQNKVINQPPHMEKLMVITEIFKIHMTLFRVTRVTTLLHICFLTYGEVCGVRDVKTLEFIQC